MITTIQAFYEAGAFRRLPPVHLAAHKIAHTSLDVPFTDLSSVEVRPVIVVGHGAWAGDLFFIPVTSRLGNADRMWAHWKQAGLKFRSGIKGRHRMITSALVRKVIGKISPSGQMRHDTMLKSRPELA